MTYARRTTLLSAFVAAVVLLLAPGTAQAAITQAFHADSGDYCHYGVTDGTLSWSYSTTTAPYKVTVAGTLTDRPLPSDPASACGDDGYASTATYSAYSGTTLVQSQTRTANNATVSFAFTLGTSTSYAGISRVVIQVCRGPVYTMPPAYCGPAATYVAPFPG